ncbi:MAG TPA: flagellar basal body P-ring formation chaperone FlgA [Bacillota bacterium]|nr:flagellar basal body P-ring formation chaperone FlgA [Bacillota bacterium]
MVKVVQRIAALILLLALISWPVFAEDGAITVEIKEDVTVGEGTIHLSDIASIQGATEEETRLIGAVELGKAPAAGRSRGMTQQYIRFKLAQAGYKGERLNLEMPEQIKVTGDGLELTPEILQRLIENSLRSKIPKFWSSWQVVFNGAFNHRWVPPGDLETVIEDDSDPLAPGPNLLQIKVLSNGNPVLRLTVAIRIEAVGKVPILQTDLEKHSLLSASAIRWEERPLNGREALHLTDEDLRTTRRLKKGEVINRLDVETAPLVYKGEKIRIVFQSDGASVTVYGIARTDGWAGQTISVENIDSKKVVSGIVVAEGRVEVK